jgi:hypothetical protein
MKLSRRLIYVVACIVLASCVGIDTNTKINTNGTVDVSLRYVVSNAADELGKLGANAKYLPLPVGEADLGLAASRAQGELRSWTRKDGNDSFTITATLRFPGVAAFALFMDPAGELATFTEANGRSTLGMTLSSGTTPADPNVLSFMKLAFGDYLVALTFELPRAATASQGFTIKGTTATFSMKAADLYASPTPVKVSVTW